MNRRPAPAAATAAAIVALLLVAPSPVHAAGRTTCTLTADSVPRTADAAQAWFDSCQQQPLPRTADAAQAWLTSAE